MDTAILDADFIPYRIGYRTDKLNGDWQFAKREVNKLIDEIAYQARTTEFIGFLGGKNNFRHDIVKQLPIEVPEYKGGRSREKSTYHYDIRDYLHEHYGFYIVNGIEADDACAIVLTNLKNSVCISGDKDLLQVPGKHIQIKQGFYEKVDVTSEGTLALSKNRKKVEGTGDRLLWSQVLTGDGVDNYNGIPGCGPVKTVNLLKDVKHEDLPHVVYQQYIKSFGDNAELMFKLTWNLAYMLRHHKDLSIPEPVNLLNL